METTDQKRYQVVKKEWGGGNGSRELRGAEVLHVAEVLDLLLRSGRLSVESSVDATVTYHHPCYLRRYNGVYEPPRRVLKALGARLVEMGLNRDEAHFCGAGGGRFWR